MSGKRTILDRLGSVKDTYIYLLTILLIALVAYTPPSVPAILPYTQTFYNYINTLGPKDVVLVCFGNSYAWFLSHEPAMIAVFHHMIDRNVKFLIFCHFNDGINIWTFNVYPSLMSHLNEKGYVYGKDYAIMPFLPGEETATAAFGANCWILPYDYYGTPFEQLPIMQNIRSAKDWTCSIDAGWVYDWAIRQWWARYNVKLLMIGHPALISAGPVYVQAGQIISFMAGWEGGAQYEALVNRPGLALQGSTIISILYIECLGLIVIGNLSWLEKRFRGTK